jgi:hypothetical protein
VKVVRRKEEAYGHGCFLKHLLLLKSSSGVSKWEESGRKVLEFQSNASAELSPEEAEEDQDHEIPRNINITRNNANPKNAGKTNIIRFNNN